MANHFHRVAETLEATKEKGWRLPHQALAKFLDYYRNTLEDTKTGMTAAYATGDDTLQMIANAFGVHYSTVSRAVSGR